MTPSPSLEHFQRELETAVSRELVGRRRTVRRRRVLRAAVVLAGAAAIAVTLVGVTWNGGGPSTSGVSPAQAVERARAALAVDAGSIRHVRIEGFQDNGDGTTASWVNEMWLQTGGSRASRSIEVGFDGVVAEQDEHAGVVRLYDASTNTIYVRPTQPEAEVLKIGQLLGTLDDGTRVVAGPNGDKVRLKPGEPLPEGAGQPVKLPRREEQQPVQDDPDDPYRAQLQAMLADRDAHVAGRVDIDGEQGTVRYVSGDGSQTYTFDAATGNPIELTTTGTTGSTRLTYTAYEKLPLSDESRALLDLAAQHPDATIDRDPAHFDEATGRLFSHG